MECNNDIICFNGTDFTNFISFVKSMVIRDKSKNTRFVILHVKEKHLVCKAIDDASNYIEYYVDMISGCESMINNTIAVSINDISALIKCTHSDTFKIRKAFNQYEFNIIGNGWLPFKTIEVDESKYNILGTEHTLGVVDSIKLKNAISSVLGYTQECTYARDKYIQFNKDRLVVTSRLSSVIINDEFPEIILHRDDAAMLKILLKDSFMLEVSKIEGAVERTKFSGQKFNFIVVAASVEQNTDISFEAIDSYITVDCDELYKLVLFAEEYSASKHIVSMTIKNGKFGISIKNILAAKHISHIESTLTGDVSDTHVEADIPTHNLLKAIKLFQDKHVRSVNIYITDSMLNDQNCILLFSGNTQAKINIYNR